MVVAVLLRSFVSEFLHNSSISLNGWDWNDGRAIKYPTKVRRTVVTIASDKYCSGGKVRIPTRRCMAMLCPKYKPRADGCVACA